MLTESELQYYNYIFQAYSGVGEVVELGPWLGLSTKLIIDSLNRNPNFRNKTLHVNEAWWQIFHESFIPDRTLIIMQDWQNHKSVPEVFWENTKTFTDSKEKHLDLIHEVVDAGIATFVYRN